MFYTLKRIYASIVWVAMFSIFSSNKESHSKRANHNDEKNNIAFERVKELLSQPSSQSTQDDEDEGCKIPNDVQFESPPNSMIWRFLRAYSYDPNIAAQSIRFCFTFFPSEFIFPCYLEKLSSSCRKCLKWRLSQSYGLSCAVREINTSTPVRF